MSVRCWSVFRDGRFSLACAQTTPYFLCCTREEMGDGYTQASFSRVYPSPCSLNAQVISREVKKSRVTIMESNTWMLRRC